LARVPTKKGFFITLEGGEGSGKSTQIVLLKEHLIKSGYSVVATREPGGTDQAEEIRDVILSGDAEELGPEFEAMLFSAARLDHVEAMINPAINDGKVVLCDRFSDSTRVYQGITGDVDLDFLTSLEELVKELAWPNLTLILDLDPKIGMKRAASRRATSAADRFEKETMEIQEKRRAAFLQIAKDNPRRCKVIDASGKADTVHKRIWGIVEPRVQKKLGKPNG